MNKTPLHSFRNYSFRRIGKRRNPAAIRTPCTGSRNTQHRSHALDTIRETSPLGKRSIGKIYKPTLEQFFTYNGGRWSLENSTSFTYDDQGRITQAESEDGGTIYRTTYTYDAWGNQTCALDETSADGGNTWVIYEKKENTYDEVVHSFQLDTTCVTARD